MLMKRNRNREAEVVAGAEVPVVNVAVAQNGQGRTLTIQIQDFHRYTEAELDAIEAERGEQVVAQCDITGELIFSKKNANELRNGERPEFDGRVMSTKFLKLLWKALGNPNTQIQDKKK